MLVSTCDFCRNDIYTCMSCLEGVVLITGYKGTQVLYTWFGKSRLGGARKAKKWGNHSLQQTTQLITYHTVQLPWQISNLSLYKALPTAGLHKSPHLQQQQHRPQLLERVKRRQLNTPTQQEQHSCCYWHWEPAWLYWSLQGPLKDVSWQTISTPDSGWSYIFTQSCSQMGLRQCCKLHTVSCQMPQPLLHT